MTFPTIRVRLPFPWPAMLILVTLWGCIVFFGYQEQDRGPPTLYEGWEILTPAVHPGEILRIRWHVRRLRNDCSFRKEDFIIDGQGTRWPPSITESGVQPGPVGEDAIVTPVPIPEKALSGDATHRVIIYYVCNTLQRVWPVVDRIGDRHFIIE